MIPAALEKMILEGKAQFKSASLGVGTQSVIQVPENGYIVIYEYYYKPFLLGLMAGNLDLAAGNYMQYVNFSNAEIFQPFQHFVQADSALNPANGLPVANYKVPDHQHRNLYLIARKDLSVFFTQSFNSPLTPGSEIFDILIETQPAITPAGYVGLNILTGIKNYHTGFIPTNPGFAPLKDKYTIPFYYTPSDDVAFDQLFFRLPAGTMPNNDVTSSLSKAAAPHIQVNYVEVFMEPSVKFNP